LPARSELRDNGGVNVAQSSVADEVRRLQTEARDLKETITALRAELENQRVAAATQKQQAIATLKDEERQLQQTIQALRDQLERDAHEHRTALEKERQRAANEMKQLHETIRALRDQLEAK
jgi:predicted  nucleic acid-binding Zn-ribbon protein